ncbi:hypothetical protein GmHk_18G053071 [Glycine max]|nr:hypothetical protein GmHk_18G053071 [Glycine max]
METHIEEMETSTVCLKERTNNESELKQMLQQLVKNQEIKQELNGSLKKHKLHKTLKSQEIILEKKRMKDEDRMEMHPSHIKKTEGIKEIKLWSERWMQEQDIMLEDRITNKQSIQEKINAHSTKQVKKTMEGSGSECCNNTEKESKIGRSSESLKPKKDLVFFEEESVSPSSSLEPPNRKSSEVDISIKGTRDAELVVEESPIKDHPMSQVGNLP